MRIYNEEKGPPSEIKKQGLRLCHFWGLFPDNHGFVERYPLRLTAFPGNVIVLSEPVVEISDKCLANAGTFLIDAVTAGICDVADALLLPHTPTYRVHFQVNLEQLRIIVCQFLETDAFGIMLEQEEDGLGQDRQPYLHVVVVDEKDAVVFGYTQTAEMFAFVYDVVKKHGVYAPVT